MGTTMTIRVDRKSTKSRIQVEVGGKENLDLREALIYAACIPGNLPFVITPGHLESLVEDPEKEMPVDVSQELKVSYGDKDLFMAKLPILRITARTLRAYDAFIAELGTVLLAAIEAMTKYTNETTEGSVMRFKVE